MPAGQPYPRVPSPPSVTSRGEAPPASQTASDASSAAGKRPFGGTPTGRLRSPKQQMAVLTGEKGSTTGRGGGGRVVDLGSGLGFSSGALDLRPHGPGAAASGGTATPTLGCAWGAKAGPVPDPCNPAAGFVGGCGERAGTPSAVDDGGLIGLDEAVRQAAASPGSGPRSGTAPASLQLSNPLFEAVGAQVLSPSPNPTSRSTADPSEAASTTARGAPLVVSCPTTQGSPTLTLQVTPPGPAEQITVAGSAGAPGSQQSSSGVPGPGGPTSGREAPVGWNSLALTLQQSSPGPHGAGGPAERRAAGGGASLALSPPRSSPREQGARGQASGGGLALTPRAAAAGADLDAAPLALAFENQAMREERADLKAELQTISARVGLSSLAL